MNSNFHSHDLCFHSLFHLKNQQTPANCPRFRQAWLTWNAAQRSCIFVFIMEKLTSGSNLIAREIYDNTKIAPAIHFNCCCSPSFSGEIYFKTDERVQKSRQFERQSWKKPGMTMQKDLVVYLRKGITK